APAALTANTWYKRVVTSGACAADTTGALAVTVNTSGTWTGVVSNAWGNTANWSCPQVPTSSTNVIIPSGTPNSPVITDAQQANNIIINTGATLTLNNANSLLRVSGDITGSGTFTNSNGKVVMEGSAAQTVKGIYRKLQINNSNGVSLSSGVVVDDYLILTNGVLTLNSSNLILGIAAYASAGSASSYIRTNSTGRLVVYNVGPSGKTGNVIIPVGNATYNPVVLANAGTLADDYTVWVIDSVTNAYSGSTPSGTKLASNAVNRTWFINEAVAGGSNASVTLQWNTADELGSFTRGSSYVSRYTGTVWNSTTASAASGSNPYTQVRTGITSFSPFGVGSNGVLPVEMLTFTGSREHSNVVLNWSTASEKNNKGFEVQRSADGKNWSKVDFVKGVGNSSSINNYMFTDFNVFTPATKQLFYRLNQTDLNGAQALSNVVIVNNQATAARFTPTVQPNPFNSYLTVNIASVTEDNAVITITDVTGKTVSVQHLACVKGDNSLSVPGMDALRSGMYFVTIQLGNEVLTNKVVKQ
ncbi:MAG: T9SS type A sorting domain-containing protein, partial [Bacteroidota bacterium]